MRDIEWLTVQFVGKQYLFGQQVTQRERCSVSVLASQDDRPHGLHIAQTRRHLVAVEVGKARAAPGEVQT